MQLVAYGAQDLYLTGNSQITFFKVVYRRHTNFAMEAIEQTFNGNPDFGKKVSCTISRNGDLVHKVWVQISLPQVNVPAGGRFRWLNHIGHILLKTIEVEIGGQRIDKHYGDWLHIWAELSQCPGHKAGYDKMIGNVPALTKVYDNPTAAGTTTLKVPAYTLYVPLEFWFCRNPGLALPLIALQYHECKINIEFQDVRSCYFYTLNGQVSTLPLGSLNATMYVDYIYLDTEERRRFAQVSHEYLLEQLQYTGEESVSGTQQKLKLNFNHPTKELVWVVQRDDVLDPAATATITNCGMQWFNYTDAYDTTYGDIQGFPFITVSANDGAGSLNPEVIAVAPFEKAGANPTALAKLQLNGHDRFSERAGDYFNWVQAYQHHENVPATGINVYSFALKPEEHQPSGSCNFSRIDNATLQLTLSSAFRTATGKFRIYATNYNVLRIMSGMGGLAYSN